MFTMTVKFCQGQLQCEWACSFLTAHQHKKAI